MTETILLGALQGIVEWLPVSSEGVLVLAQTALPGGATTLSGMIAFSLYLHLGTFFAALVYFRKDVWHLIRSVFVFQSSDAETRATISFLVIATLLSGVLGAFLLWGITFVESVVTLASSIVMAGIGVLLLITAALQFFAQYTGQRTARDLTHVDSVILGITQALAALPGFSRSGLTVSALLLRNVRSREALRLSFLLSLPIVLGGNIVLNLNGSAFSLTNLAGLIAAFVTGLATIHGLLLLAQRINFAYFVGIFGLLTLGAALFI